MSGYHREAYCTWRQLHFQHRLHRQWHEVSICIPVFLSPKKVRFLRNFNEVSVNYKQLESSSFIDYLDNDDNDNDSNNYDDDHDDDNNSNNYTERGNLRFLYLQLTAHYLFATRTLKKPGRTRVQITCNRSRTLPV